MNTYNPDKAPDPARWLALDEQRRIQLAEKYHRAARTRLPNECAGRWLGCRTSVAR
mgnify:CR=1 FL=1